VQAETQPLRDSMPSSRSRTQARDGDDSVNQHVADAAAFRGRRSSSTAREPRRPASLKSARGGLTCIPSARPWSGTVIDFDDDDQGYLRWVAAHPRGFVLNVRRRRDPGYVVLHRATCPSISATRVGEAHTGRGFRKVCSVQLEELREAAALAGRHDRSFSKACGLCKPRIKT
jgi:hypothetical protein